MASNDSMHHPVGTLDLNELTPDKKDDINFIQFTPVPLKNSENVDSWLESTWYIEDDLHRLLSMPLQKFWCQVIFDDSLHKCITGFLRHAPRVNFPLNENKFSEQVKRRLNSLGRMFFLTCLRMSTYKEDKSQMIPTHAFGDILYENFLFDIPRLLDFCSLYAETNGNLVEQIIKNIFTVQPKYLDDIKAVSEALPVVLKSICNKFSLDKHSFDCGAPRKMSKSSSSDAQDFLAGVLTQAHDTFNSLRAFFEVYNPATQAFYSHSILSEIAEFYNLFCERLCEEFEKLDASEELSRAFCVTRYTILQVFRQIVYNSTVMIMFENLKHVEKIIDSYISSLQLVLDDSHFISDYFHFFPIEEDIELIEQTGFKLDEVGLNCIKSSISRSMELYIPTIPDDSSPPELQNSHFSEDEEGDEYLGACAGALPVKDAMLSKILSIQELLPHLGLGFIKRCLDAFNGDLEAAMNAIFEGNLPQDLKGIDQTLELESSETEDSNCGDEPQSSASIPRHNVYDGDQFDIFSNSIDLSKIHLGKKNEEMAINSADFKLKEKIKYLGQRMDDEEEARENASMYLDEYDDTYDDMNLGKVDIDSVDELTSKNCFVVRRLNNPLYELEDEEEEEEEEDQQKKNPASFLEDPALIRDRWAKRNGQQAIQRDQAGNGFRGGYGANRGRGGRGGRGGGFGGRGGHGGFGALGGAHDGRENKDRYKENKINHNRRDLAAKKRRI